MSDPKKYLDLKERVEKAQQRAAKAEGALGQVLKQLKEEFKCNSLEEAETLLKRMQKKEKEAQQELDKAMEEFETKWAEQI
jgi:predicted  nucleic acid-binding Zn-ribbon protein